MKNTYLPPVLAHAETLIQAAKSEFSGLSEAQLNWKSAPNKWSIGQCLHHLITSNNLYFEQLDQVAGGRKKQSFLEKIGFLSRFWGKYLLRETGAVPNKPMTSPQPFRPSQSNIPLQVVNDFERQTTILLQKMAATDNVDHQKIALTSPAAGFITYSLHDACNILVNHLERHINQARRVKANSGFPH